MKTTSSFQILHSTSSTDELNVPGLGCVDKKILQELNLSLYPFCAHALIIRVKDSQTSDVIPVYIDSNKLPYLKGLLPGAFVGFHRVYRRRSRSGNIYCSVIPDVSFVTVVYLNRSRSFNGNDSEDGTMVAHESASVPRRNLDDFAQDIVQRKSSVSVWRIRCRVSAVQFAILEWKCSECGSKVNLGKCTTGCKGKWKFFSQLRY